MPLKLLTAAEYLAGKKDIVLRNGLALTQGVVNGKPPAIKTAVASAAADLIADIIATDVEFAITEKLNFQTMMNAREDDPAAFDAALEADVTSELFDVANFAGASKLLEGANLHEPGRPYDIAKALSRAVADKMKPLPMHAGKWLAGIGIAQPDLDGVAIQAAPPLAAIPPATKAEAEHQARHPDMPLPPPLPSAPTIAQPPAISAADDDFAAMMGGEEIEGATGVPPSVPPVPAASSAAPPPAAQPGDAASSAPGQALPPTAAPDKDAIGRAFELWYECGGGGLDEVSKGLGVSVGTLRNRCTGRSKGPITVKQAAYMRKDIDVRMASLTEAAAIFSAVR